MQAEMAIKKSAKFLSNLKVFAQMLERCIC